MRVTKNLRGTTLWMSVGMWQQKPIDRKAKYLPTANALPLRPVPPLASRIIRSHPYSSHPSALSTSSTKLLKGMGKDDATTVYCRCRFNDKRLKLWPFRCMSASKHSSEMGRSVSAVISSRGSFTVLLPSQRNHILADGEHFLRPTRRLHLRGESLTSRERRSIPFSWEFSFGLRWVFVGPRYVTVGTGMSGMI